MPRRALSALRAVLTAPAVPVRRVWHAVRLRRDRLGGLVHALLLLAGLAAGLLLALPLSDVSGRCPARGEGYGFCALQKAWLPAVFTVLTAIAVAQALAWAALVRFSAWRERVRTIGERRVGEEESRDDPPYDRDPFLLAATWGEKHGPGERRRPSLLTLLARLRRR